MPAKKPPERRHNVNTKDTGLVRMLPGIPSLPPGNPDWVPDVLEAWSEFWSSPLADPHVLKPTDTPALRRLFDLRDRLAKAQAQFDEEPMSAGSMGQPTLSPWAAEIHRLEAEVDKLEDRFGLTPLARLRLGVIFEEGTNLASRNAQLLAQFHASQGG